MTSIKEKLTTMFSKVMAGTVTREEGTMLINHLFKENQVDTIKELSYLIDNPPPGVFPKTILHTIALSRNKAFYKIMIASLEHKNEDVSILAAQELAKLHTADAKKVLVEHLNSEVYHVRKASASALAQGFAEGFDVLKGLILSSSESFYRSTYAQALLKSGKKGIDALLQILNSGNPGAMESSSEALTAGAEELDGEDIPKIFEALMSAGDRKDSAALVCLLKLISSLKRNTRGFEGYVQAFADYPHEPVRNEAQNALKNIRAVS